MSTVKLINGFVWAIVDQDEAAEYYSNDGEVFELYDDMSEGLILDSTDIVLAVMNGRELGIELGHKSELQSDYDEACARNNETRSFEAWLEAKAESLVQ